MTNKPTGGFAYPQAERVGDISESTGGLTIRDAFAIAAMQGLLSTPYSVDPVNIATAAYKMADAMIFERAN